MYACACGCMLVTAKDFYVYDNTFDIITFFDIFHIA